MQQCMLGAMDKVCTQHALQFESFLMVTIVEIHLLILDIC